MSQYGLEIFPWVFALLEDFLNLNYDIPSLTAVEVRVYVMYNLLGFLLYCSMVIVGGSNLHFVFVNLTHAWMGPACVASDSWRLIKHPLAVWALETSFHFHLMNLGYFFSQNFCDLFGILFLGYELLAQGLHLQGYRNIAVLSCRLIWERFKVCERLF